MYTEAIEFCLEKMPVSKWHKQVIIQHIREWCKEQNFIKFDANRLNKVKLDILRYYLLKNCGIKEKTQNCSRITVLYAIDFNKVQELTDNEIERWSLM